MQFGSVNRSFFLLILAGALVLPSVHLGIAQSQGGSPAQGSSPAAAPQPTGGPVLAATLTCNLSTKTAKPGDPVTAKTVRDLKLKDLDIPKGSKLVGTVAATTSKDAGNGNSSLAIRFDHVELKGGSAVLRIQGLIVAIGALANEEGIGASSVLSRGGGYGSGLNPNSINGEHQEDIPAGSTLEGVALGKNFNAQGATELRGVRREIRLDSNVMIKVALYKGP